MLGERPLHIKPATSECSLLWFWGGKNSRVFLSGAGKGHCLVGLLRSGGLSCFIWYDTFDCANCTFEEDEIHKNKEKIALSARHHIH